MIKGMDDYWSIQHDVLYPKDEYYRDHTLDVGEFLEISIIVSVLAVTMIGFICLVRWFI